MVKLKWRGDIPRVVDLGDGERRFLLRTWEAATDVLLRAYGITRLHVNHDPGDEDRT